jgi:hypothetical protein
MEERRFHIVPDQEPKMDKAADHLHNYPDFKIDMANGFLLGEHEGKYYFWSKGNIGILEGEYSVANNVSNFFNGALVSTNSRLRFIPPKLLLEVISKVGDEETPPTLNLPKNFPFTAEVLCLETMRKVESALTLRTGINGWNHFVIILEKFVSELGNNAIYFEGVDCYCFLSLDDALIHYNPETMNFDWQFAETLSGFKISKKSIMTLINRQRFL